jgi:hypothetical protein
VSALVALFGIFFVFLFVFIFGLWLAAVIFWIVTIVEVARIPDHQFRAAATEKLVWILVVVLAGVIGALVWRFVKRNDVLLAAGRVPAPPAGWYPEAGSGALRWWDGARWTEARHVPPGVGRPPSN